MKRILSISGGGMRGVIPGRLLMELEDTNKKPIHEMFDLITGTSTGGILATLSAFGVPSWKSLQFYYDAGPRIFSSGLRKFFSGGGLFSTKYSDKNLSKELQTAIPPRELGEALTKVMLTTVRGDNHAEMIKSWDDWGGQWPAWEAAKATSSAQVFFPPHTYSGQKFYDGGNVRNNPVACALLEAIRLWPGELIQLVSIGTGVETKPRTLPTGGAISWVAELFNTTTLADDSYDHYAVSQIAQLIPVDYRKFETKLTRFPSMDDAKSKTLDELVKSAETTIKENKEALKL